MKIIDVTELALGGIKIIRFGRFPDDRGYFTEPFRKSDVMDHPALIDLHGREFVQMNESFSRVGVIRGLHFQWNPFMGKLVRTICGRMVDMVLDIRKGSPTAGKALLYDMPGDRGSNWGEWIWVPPGFAHGNFFTAETQIEYFCTGEYSPGNEAGISPFAQDIDWSFSPHGLYAEFRTLREKGLGISPKDSAGIEFGTWMADERSEQFIFGKC